MYPFCRMKMFTVFMFAIMVLFISSIILISGQNNADHRIIKDSSTAEMYFERCELIIILYK